MPTPSATMRGSAAAISASRGSACGVSTRPMKRVWPGWRPSAASRAATASDSSRTCSGPISLGSLSAVTAGMTAASMSRTAISSGRLMRTPTSAPPCPTLAAAAASASRAACFSAGAIESSRSRMTTSAPRVCALATKRSAVVGT